MTADILIWLGAAILVVVGFAGLILPAIPGPPILLAGLVMAAWAEDFVYAGPTTIIILVVMCVVAVALDFIAGALGAKRYGASRPAIIGAAGGALIGIFFGPVGLLLGPFVGALLGELSTGRPMEQAGRSGIGATVGLLLGTVAKLVIGLMMIGTYVIVRLTG